MQKTQEELRKELNCAYCAANEQAHIPSWVEFASSRVCTCLRLDVPSRNPLRNKNDPSGVTIKEPLTPYKIRPSGSFVKLLFPTICRF